MQSVYKINSYKINFKIKMLLSFLFLLSVTQISLASQSVGTIDTISKYARICQDASCTTYGSINMKPTINGSTPGALSVTITDTVVTGHAWGDQIGWINFAPTGSGVTVNPNTGVLSGFAYAQNGSWINFAPTGQSVTLVDNGSGSNFSGWAYASGISGGWLRLDCGSASTCVKTDWRTISNRTVVTTGTSGGGGGGGGSLVIIPATNTAVPIETPQETAPSSKYNKGYILKTGEVNGVESSKYNYDMMKSAPQLKVVAGLNSDDVANVYKLLFSIHSDWSVEEPDCIFCLVLRKQDLHQDIKILKWNFVPVDREIRLETSTLVPIISRPVPDIELISLVSTAAVGYFAWKYLLYAIIKKLIIK